MSQFISLQRNCVGVYVLSGSLQAAASLRPLVFACFINMAMWLRCAAAAPRGKPLSLLFPSMHLAAVTNYLSEGGSE